MRCRLRPSVLDTRVYGGADIDSDHRLVIASFRLRLAKKVKCRKGKMYSVSNSQIDELRTWKKSRSVSMTERRRKVLKQHGRN